MGGSSRCGTASSQRAGGDYATGFDLDGYKSHLFIISLHHLGFSEVDLGLEADLGFSEEDFGIGSRFGTFGRGFWDFGSIVGSVVGICGSIVGDFYFSGTIVFIISFHLRLHS